MSAAKDLLNNYQHVIESLNIVTGAKGVFDVTVDGKLLYSKHGEGRHAEPEEVLALFVEEYAQGVKRYAKN